MHLPSLPDRVIRGGAALLAVTGCLWLQGVRRAAAMVSGIADGRPGMKQPNVERLVHRVLECFWKNVKTQEELKAMTTSERDDCSWTGALHRTEAPAGRDATRGISRMSIWNADDYIICWTMARSRTGQDRPSR